MLVIKKSGQSAQFDRSQIQADLSQLVNGLDTQLINQEELIDKVMAGLYSGVKVSEIRDLMAETAASMTTVHPDYANLAGRIVMQGIHRQTNELLVSALQELHDVVDPRTGLPAPMIAEDVLAIAKANETELQAAMDFSRDYGYDFFAVKTMQKGYMLANHGVTVERPQHMIMRVALGIHKSDIPQVLRTYEDMSDRWMTHATPTMFNAGTPRPQMSSCFLLTIKDDSVVGIYETLKDCALISQSGGGVGLAVHNVRATGSFIRGGAGISDGLMPMLRVYNDTARYISQGGGKRKGAFALFLEPWHADIFEFLDAKKNHGKEEMRARDLFYALWTPDLFMKRVEQNGDWTLMCPNECPGLADCWGAEFEALYTRYEREGRGKKTIKAQELWFHILECQTETGTPYLCFKDAANSKSNQQNLGTIKSSNLCTEILEYTAPDEVAVCNLASLALPRYLKVNQDGQLVFDHVRLYEVAYQATVNLNRVIDNNYYPIPETERSNLRHRPVGLGVQGLADAFIQLGLPFESEPAKRLNEDIFETIYFAAMTASKDEAKAIYLQQLEGYHADPQALNKQAGAYQTFPGSPLSHGKFQFDLWGVTPKSGRYDWEALRQEVLTYGVRNSLLVAPMPTASTAQILGNNESFEPYTSNVYLRRVISGEFMVVNKHLLRDLIKIGVWDENMKQALIAANGSVQNLPIPQRLKDLYRTVWEISQRTIIDMAADRGAYVCQSQSLNLHVQNPNFGKLTSMHFHSWKCGLKTGMYYLRTKAAADAIKFTVPSGKETKPAYSDQEAMVCSIDNPDACEACGS